ncbi:MAG: hypothetical protein H7Z73_11305 [Candidatus Saccharibacteria bacterium]|nr:hypothetical protein [Moraxellaceae bacterium]
MIEENKNVAESICSLDWNNELSIQQNGIQSVLDMVKNNQLDVKNLIQPSLGKQYWENSARVLLQLPQEFISGNEGLLLDAIQDINWPGTELIIELLSRQPISTIIQLYKNAYENTKLVEDDLWVRGLYLLGEKLNTQNNLDDILAKMRLYLDSMG